MSNNISRIKGWSIALNIGLYVLAAALSFYLIPKTGKFEMSFEIGRPWAYGLVTAPVDFPVYKLNNELKSERDSAAKRVEPYVRAVAFTVPQISPKRGKFSVSLCKYINGELKDIYKNGVVSIEDYSRLKEFSTSHVYLISKDNIAKRVDISTLFTMRTAYGRIVSNAANFSNRDKKALSRISFDQMLKSNVEFDIEKTKRSQEEAIRMVSPTMGVVQKGEKLIDRGEVVDLEAYKNLRSLKKVSADIDKDKATYNSYSEGGKLLLVIAFFAFLYSYFHFFRPNNFKSFRTTLFMLMMCMGVIMAASCIVQFTVISIYIVPFAILPIVVRIFFDSRTALFLHIITVFICSLMVASPYEFLIVQISVGIVAVSSLRDLHARSQLMSSAIVIFITYIVMHSAVQLAQGMSIDEFKWVLFAIFAVNSVLILFAYGLIYIVEKLFGFFSSMTLVELSNVNNGLLMDFSERCPGTFQHALQVSNLSVEVAKKINANALLARTGALYHDIGKMDNPMLYTENQAMGVNPLNEFSFDQAAQIIISHVQSGIKIAQKHGLPKQLIEFIATHHGTSKTRYFYNSYKNAFPDSTIDDSIFSYPGPLPSSKEAVIVMMADSIEAASRSLKDYNEESIDKMVEGIIEGQMAEGQYKNAPISFLQVEMAKRIFKDKLKTIYHNRITYPELDNKV